MIRIAVLGCGRIGAMHAVNTAAQTWALLTEGCVVRTSEVG